MRARRTGSDGEAGDGQGSGSGVLADGEDQSELLGHFWAYFLQGVRINLLLFLRVQLSVVEFGAGCGVRSRSNIRSGSFKGEKGTQIMVYCYVYKCRL